jgi:thiamine biosynthesis lipoprotein
MKYIKVIFFLFLLVGTIVILYRHQGGYDMSFLVSEGRIFGTYYKVVYEHTHQLEEEIASELRKVDNSLSLFNRKSTLSRINSGATDDVDSLFREVFTLSQTIAASTNGAFDPTVAPAVNAWGFGPNRKSDLTQAVIDSLSELIDYRKVQLVGDSAIYRADNRISLDYGAVAKGFGVDCIARLLVDKGVKNFMVEIGGEVIVNGVNEKGSSWRIGIQDPTAEDSSIKKVITLNNAAMATSGNYRNYYVTEQGVRVAHTIDPRTATPVSHSLLSATVIAPSCAVADAYATAFMVMGIDSAKNLLQTHPELSVYFIYDDNGTLSTYSTIN